MRKTSSVLAASIIVLALSACIDDGVSVDFMNRNGEFITGGVTDSSFPAVGALVTPYFNESFCTGTLITPTRVLTAAHCVEATWPEDLKMAFGPDENHWTHVIDVIRVTSHYDYKVMTGVRPSDIAYLDLAEAPEGIVPIPAISESLAGREGERWLFMGYGVSEYYYDDSGEQQWYNSGIKRSVVLPVSDIQDIPGEFTYYAQDTDSNNAGNTCYGDSGGPALAYNMNGDVVAVGVTSRGDGDCAAIGALGIDTRVDTFYGWLHKNIETEEAEDDFDYEGYLNEDEDSTGETTDEIIDGEVIDEEVAEEAAPEEEAAEEAAPEEDVATGGQCSPCESDLDCAGEARCFLLEGESQAACHDSCESDADCSGEDAYCADITAGYNLRCISCL